MARDFVFLPYVLTDLAFRSEAPDVGGGTAPVGFRRRLSLKVVPLIDGVAVDTGERSYVELYGAHDIVAIDRDYIKSTEPAAGTQGFEPNYFPHIEFIDADYPWRYTLDSPDLVISGRLRPWVGLIALREDEFEPAAIGGAVMDAIRVTSPGTSLPDLSQSWAWAHVQLDAITADGERLETNDILANHPERQCSRLLCPRKLNDRTTYHAFLVPLFQGGVNAGLGRPSSPERWKEDAWVAGSPDPVVLPYLYSWSFTTSVLDDFETLVRRLKPYDLDAARVRGDTTGMQARGGVPGYFTRDEYHDAGHVFEVEGALAPIGFMDDRQPFATDDLSRLVLNTCNTVLNQRTTCDHDGPDAEDPLVAIPVYGSRYRMPHALGLPSGDSEFIDPHHWEAEVNLDRRYRLAAGEGVRVVRSKQEDFMRACWAQIGEVRRANELLVRLRMARRLNAHLEQKVVAKLPVAVVATLASPLFSMVPADDGRHSLDIEISNRGLPRGYLTLAARKLAAKKPEISQSTPSDGRLARSRRRIPETVLPVLESESDAPAERRAPSPSRHQSWFATVVPGLRPSVMNQIITPFRTGGRLELDLQTLPLDEFCKQVKNLVLEGPVRRARSTIKNVDLGTLERLDLIMAAPRVPEPLSEILASRNKDMMLPGIGSVPYDSAFLARENLRALESIMVGANQEMNAELRWREYPCDLRGTILPRFWNNGYPAMDEAGDDIGPIHEWMNKLGNNWKSGGSGTRVVLVIRGELASRFPGLLAACDRQELAPPWSAAGSQAVAPRFWGSIGADTRYFGFDLDLDQFKTHVDDYYFLLFEPTGRYRFGLDIANQNARRERTDLRTAPLPFPLPSLSATRRQEIIRIVGGKRLGVPVTGTDVLRTWDDLSWSNVRRTSSDYIDFGLEITPDDENDMQWGPGRTSASLASVLFQKPIRAIIPAKELVSLD